MPENPAGCRIEPPVSVPVAPMAARAATAAPEPPDEPLGSIGPGQCARWGFLGRRGEAAWPLVCGDVRLGQLSRRELFFLQPRARARDGEVGAYRHHSTPLGTTKKPCACCGALDRIFAGA